MPLERSAPNPGPNRHLHFFKLYPGAYPRSLAYQHADHQQSCFHADYSMNKTLAG